MARGMKTGGRRKGVPNKATALKRQIEAELSSGQVLPLAHMLKVMRDHKADDARRDFMAKAAAPYMHRSLKAVEHTGEGGGAVKVEVTWLDAPCEGS